MASPLPALRSIGVFCGSATGRDAGHAADAEALGRLIARAGLELVYGGGGVGLMGVCARAALAEGGRVTGVIPEFLMRPELALETADLVVVPSMHARKAEMFARAEAFVVLPGGIGTIEEAVELLSWGRLNLHRKPVVFLGRQGFWRPFFDLVAHTVAQGFTPAAFEDLYGCAETPEAALTQLTASARPAEPAPIALI